MSDTPVALSPALAPEGEQFSALPPLDRVRIRLQRIGQLKEFWDVRDGEIEAELAALDAVLQRLQGWQPQGSDPCLCCSQMQPCQDGCACKVEPAPPAPGSARPTEGK